MWASLLKKTLSTLGAGNSSLVLRPFGLLLTAVLSANLLSISAAAQDSASRLAPPNAEAQMDSLASRVAGQIRQSKIDPENTKVFVFDFSNAVDKEFSKLGRLLADHFSAALRNQADGFVVLDRQLLTAYLKDNWIDQKAIQSNGIALALARSMGATAVVRGDLKEQPDHQFLLTLRLEGFGPAWSAESLLTLTGEMQALFREPLPTFMRSSPIPAEPGVLIPGLDGVGIPECIYCPPPLYDDDARAAKYQGTIELSVVVTPDGRSDSILVLQGAPFLLNKQAVEAVQKWKFKPAEKDGKPVRVRVPIEITLRVN
jgi:TonB family protein